MSDEVAAPRRRVRLRGQRWFPIEPQRDDLPDRTPVGASEPLDEATAEPAVAAPESLDEALDEAPAEPDTGDKILAVLYLVSVFMVPVVVLCWVFEVLGGREIYYVIPLFAAGAVPWLLAVELCEASGRSEYPWHALRAQIWLQLGGGVPAALRAIRNGRAQDGDR
ncbi:hypothetical protein [Kribbella sp. NPDC051770]|uniref:hypothetical protein n=1 Tax=Kribbella sp. NPDC051770 TaxID=3155413 RepID=UPI00343754D5